MKTVTKLLAGAGAAVVLASAAPAAAQYDYRYRTRVDEVVDGVARVAGAVAAATQGGYYDPRYGNRYGYGYGNRYGYNQGGERYAADACAYEAQRRYARRYGGVGVNIDSVQWYRADRLRVYGTMQLGNYSNYGRYNRYDRYGYNRYGGQVGFSCSVRPDGRVTDFDTQRYNNRYYGY